MFWSSTSIYSEIAYIRSTFSWRKVLPKNYKNKNSSTHWRTTEAARTREVKALKRREIHWRRLHILCFSSRKRIWNCYAHLGTERPRRKQQVKHVSTDTQTVEFRFTKATRPGTAKISNKTVAWSKTNTVPSKIPMWHNYKAGIGVSRRLNTKQIWGDLQGCKESRVHVKHPKSSVGSSKRTMP